MKEWILVFLLHLSLVGSSQINLKVDLAHLAFGFPTTQSIRMAAEVQFAEHYSVQGEYGLSLAQIAPSFNKDLTNMNSEIWRCEIRRYFDYKNDKGRYFALDFFQKKQTYNQFWTTGQTVGDQFITTEQWLSVKRNERAVNLIFGYQSNQNKHRRLLFEGYIGVGARLRIVENDLAENWRLINPKWNLIDKEQNRIIPSVVIGFRLGFEVLSFRRRYR